jgi:hypothetical protein
MDQLPRPVPARRGLCNKSLRGAKPRNLLVEQRALGLWWRHVKAAMASMSKSLAQTNKSQDRVKATKRYRPKGECEKQRTSTFSHHRRVKGPSLIRSVN